MPRPSTIVPRLQPASEDRQICRSTPQLACYQEHAAIKRDPARWAELQYVGLWNFEDGGPTLELRNCPSCKSSLAIEVEPAATTEAA